MPGNPTQSIEDAIQVRADAERERPGISFAPIYAFVSNIAQIARGQERQAIIDALPKREQGRSVEWNAGFDAAVTAFIRILATRSM